MGGAGGEFVEALEEAEGPAAGIPRQSAVVVKVIFFFFCGGRVSSC